MARDPDSLETTTTTDQPTQTGASAGPEFASGPSRAERVMTREQRALPLWPWLLIIAIAFVVVVIISLS